MLTVRFVRHGESLANSGGVTGEPAAVPLTPLGWRQADAFAAALAEPPDLIITSPYDRARDTAAATAARFPQVPLETWPVQEIASLAVARALNTSSMQRLPMVEAHWARGDPLHCDGAGAECYADFVARVRAALDRLAALPPRRVLLFSHGQFMNGVLWEITMGGLPVTPESMRAFRAFHTTQPIENIKGFTARWDGVKWCIID
jgi:probable phosphoglycerate mutase